jgi:hypothetical protein
MEQPTVSLPSTNPVQPMTQPQTPQSPPVFQKPKRRFDPRFLFILLIIVGIGGGFFAGSGQKTELPTPTPSDTPTPSPKSKPMVPMATESAYLELIKNVASLSGAINTIQISDTTLSPPTVELPLGFPNE